MIVLGIETSGLDGSIALLRDDQIVGERQLNASGRRHAQSLVLEIRELLTSNNLRSRDIDLIAVSRGPGSFTGLRVGMVCAKTFAYAIRCKFLAVDTFAAIAQNLPQDVTRALIIEDAQRDDLFVGEYRKDESGHWNQVDPIQIESVEHFQVRAANWSGAVTGPGLKKIDVAVSSTWQPQPECTRPKASSIAKLACRRILSDDAYDLANDTDFWKATPFYLRQSAAEEKRAKS